MQASDELTKCCALQPPHFSRYLCFVRGHHQHRMEEQDPIDQPLLLNPGQAGPGPEALMVSLPAEHSVMSAYSLLCPFVFIP